MNIKARVHAAIGEELLTNVIMSLRTISDGVDAKVIEVIAKSAIAQYNIKWNNNNDLGIVTNRLINSSERLVTADIQEDALYEKVRFNDELVSSTISELANKIAFSVSPALFTLRNVIHGECETLVNKINANLLNPEFISYKSEEFDWGNLKNVATEQAAIFVAQQATDSIKNGAPTIYDTPRIANSIPVAYIAAVDTSVRDAIVKFLSTETPSEDLQQFAKCVTNVAAFNVWSSDNKLALTDQLDNLALGLIGMIKKLDVFNSYIDKLETASLEISEASDTTLRNNLKILRTETMLAYAGSIYYRNLMKNSAVLTKTHLNADALPFLKSNGCTEADAIAHMRYNVQVLEVPIPKHGVPVMRIVDNKAITNEAVAEFDMRAKNVNTMAQRATLQRSIRNTLNEHFSKAEKPTNITSMTYREMHETGLAKAFSKAGKDTYDLYSIATEYLVDMNGNSLVKTLYKTVDKRLNALISASESHTDTDIKASLCGAVTDVVLGILVKGFSTYTQKEAA